MNEMVGYIFGKLSISEETTHQIFKVLKKQSSFNKAVVLFAGATVLYMYVNECERNRLHKEIKALKEEIEELNVAKGE